MHKITVGKKLKNCPFYGKGSEDCLYVNNVAVPLLTLERGKKYRFQLECKNHQFVIASDEQLKNSLSEIVSEGQITLEIKDDYPDHLYYGCLLHPQEGGPIEITADDSVVLNALNLKKIIRSPVAIKSYGQYLIIGLESGTFYSCDQDNKLVQLFGFKAILEKSVKLLDFTVINQRIYSLISGHKDNKLSLIEVSNFDGKEEDFKLFDLMSVDSHTGLLASIENHLYLATGKTLSKINVSISAEYKIVEEEPLNPEIKTLTSFQNQLYLFNHHLIKDKKEIYKLNFVPTCAEFIPTEKGYSLFYADNTGNLAVIYGNEDIKPGWKTNSLKGIKSILYHQKQIYILVNNSENKVELWQMVGY